MRCDLTWLTSRYTLHLRPGLPGHLRRLPRRRLLHPRRALRRRGRRAAGGGLRRPARRDPVAVPPGRRRRSSESDWVEVDEEGERKTHGRRRRRPAGLHLPQPPRLRRRRRLRAARPRATARAAEPARDQAGRVLAAADPPHLPRGRARRTAPPTPRCRSASTTAAAGGRAATTWTGTAPATPRRTSPPEPLYLQPRAPSSTALMGPAAYDELVGTARPTCAPARRWRCTPPTRRDLTVGRTSDGESSDRPQHSPDSTVRQSRLPVTRRSLSGCGRRHNRRHAPRPSLLRRRTRRTGRPPPSASAPCWAPSSSTVASTPGSVPATWCCRWPTAPTSRSSRCSTTRPRTRPRSARPSAPAPRSAAAGSAGSSPSTTSPSVEQRLGRAAVAGNRHRPDGTELRWRQIGVHGLHRRPPAAVLRRSGRRPAELHPERRRRRPLLPGLPGDRRRPAAASASGSASPSRPRSRTSRSTGSPRNGTPGIMAAQFQTPHGLVRI